MENYTSFCSQKSIVYCTYHFKITDEFLNKAYLSKFVQKKTDRRDKKKLARKNLLEDQII